MAVLGDFLPADLLNMQAAMAKRWDDRMFHAVMAGVAPAGLLYDVDARMPYEPPKPASVVGRVVGYNTTNAHDYFRGMGRQLGSGCYKTAYAVTVAAPVPDFVPRPIDHGPVAFEVPTEERCVLVAKLDPASKGVWKLAMDYQHDPYCPKVHDMVDLSDGGFAVETEVLHDIPKGKAGQHSSLTVWAVGDRYGGVFSDRLCQLSSFAAAIRRYAGDKGHSWDTHTGNFMLRQPDHQLVITDPLV